MARVRRDDIVDQVADKVADKIVEKARNQQAKIEEKAAKHLLSLERLAAHLETLETWTRAEGAARKPRFSREEIAAAAVRLADAEGFEAVSMRRLAAELDAGTMTLYHYVRTKDELLTLVSDAVMGEVVVPEGEDIPEDWRAAMTVIADRSRAALVRHPWILDITDDPPFGPNAVKHFDQSLQAVSHLDLTLAEKLDVVSMVDEYVFGYCLHERNNFPADEGTEVDLSEHVGEYVAQLVDGGGYPCLAELRDTVGLDAVWTTVEEHHRDGERFHRNLGRVLDGIEAAIL